MDRVCISVAAPALRSEFGYSPQEIGLIFGAFSLSYALFQAPWGWLGDRRDVRGLIGGVILCWSLFTVLTATAASLISLIIVRFLFGVSEAALSPLIASAFRRTVSAARSSSAFGFFLAGGRLGGMIAPFIAARCVARYGWRFAFFAFGAVGIMAFVVWFLASPRTMISQTHQEPSIAPRPLFSAPLLALIFTALLYTMAWQFFATWFPTYLIDVRHFALQSVGKYAGLPFFFGLCATALGRSFRRRRDRVFWNRPREAIGVLCQLACRDVVVLLRLNYRESQDQCNPAFAGRRSRRLHLGKPLGIRCRSWRQIGRSYFGPHEFSRKRGRLPVASGDWSSVEQALRMDNNFTADGTALRSRGVPISFCAHIFCEPPLFNTGKRIAGATVNTPGPLSDRGADASTRETHSLPNVPRCGTRNDRHGESYLRDDDGQLRRLPPRTQRPKRGVNRVERETTSIR